MGSSAQEHRLQTRDSKWPPTATPPALAPSPPEGFPWSQGTWILGSSPFTFFVPQIPGLASGDKHLYFWGLQRGSGWDHK